MIHFSLKNRPAVTMIELVFVIIVLGILASMALPRLNADKTQEAADNILSDIRYTQHLALMDDKHNYHDPKWQKSFWRIGFESCASTTGMFEYIGTDMNYAGDINNDEAATDPANNKKMNWVNTATCSIGGDSSTSDRIFITHKYGITSVVWSENCRTAQYIGFDHLGRTHQGFAGIAGDTPNYSTYLTSLCTITFNMSNGDNFAINIEPETGYAYINTQNDS